MRNRRWMYGALTLIACLGFGAALGLWLYTIAGGHVYVVPRPFLLISALVGPICACVGAFAFVMVATGARTYTDTPPRDAHGS
jgi:hypothetical protein